MKIKNLTAILTAGILGLGLLAGCGSQTAETSAGAGSSSAEGSTETAGAAGESAESDAAQGDDSGAAESGEVRTIKFAFVQTGVPFGYVDENGNATGYDIEVLRLADELLPEYEFEFIPSTQPDACAGTIEGKYQVAITNSFYTEERDQNYIIPEQFLGVSVGGVITRTEYADVKNFDDAVAKGLRYAPVIAGDGWTFVVKEYNENHPDGQIELELVDSIETATEYQYIAEGRYDYIGAPISTFNELVADENGALHDALGDKLVCNPFIAVKTYTLISREEPEFAEKLNGALKTLYEDGSMREIAIEFYHEDTFRYLEDGGDRGALTD